jgi:polysaccharide biosynthesis protein PelA
MRGGGLGRRELIALGLALPFLTRRKAQAAASSLAWGIDYGPRTDPELARGYSLLVLEPDHARPIAPLRGPSSRLLGYISMGEVERSRPFVTRLQRAGALRAPNPNWPDARYVDLRHPLWRTLLLDTIIPRILNKGFDGIFLDTMDNAEAMERQDPKGNAGMVAAGARLIRAIRQRYPKCAIMLNRGYAMLPDVASRIDFVLGEAMATRWNFTRNAYEMVSESDWVWQATRLRAAKRINPSLVLTTLDYWDPADARTVAELYSRSRAADFHPYVATLSLNRLMPEPRS